VTTPGNTAARRPWVVVAVVMVPVLVVLAVASWLLSNAKSEPEIAGDPPDAVPASDGSLDPAGLVGFYAVSGSEVLADKVVQLRAGGGLRVTDEQTGGGRDACTWMGGWRATASGLMILTVQATSGRCGGDQLDGAWEAFDGVQRWEPSARGVLLTGLDGEFVMTLHPNVGSLLPRDDYQPESTATVLPAGVDPVPLRVLQRARWLPVDRSGQPDPRSTDTANAPVPGFPFRTPPRPARYPYAGFEPGGEWGGSDGCNGLGGKWSYDDQTGEWMASTRGQTEIFCDNVDVSGTIAPARSMGLDATGLLVFYASDGSVTGRFIQQET
jgi:hypothetical protein